MGEFNQSNISTQGKISNRWDTCVSRRGKRFGLYITPGHGHRPCWSLIMLHIAYRAPFTAARSYCPFLFIYFNLTYSRWTSSLPSCLWSLPGSRLTIFYRDGSSAILQLLNQWLSSLHTNSACFLPIHSGHQVRWTYQPGSHRRKVTRDFSSTFFLRCVP